MPGTILGACDTLMTKPPTKNAPSPKRFPDFSKYFDIQTPNEKEEI